MLILKHLLKNGKSTRKITFSPETLTYINLLIDNSYLPGMNTSTNYRKEGLEALLTLEYFKALEAEKANETKEIIKIPKPQTLKEKLEKKLPEYTTRVHGVGMSGRDPLLETLFDFYVGGKGLEVLKTLKFSPFLKKGADGRFFNSKIVRNPNNYYRAVKKDAIIDAKQSRIIRGNPHRKDDPYPFFARLLEPYKTNFVIEGTPESSDWISTYRYIYSKEPKLVKMPRTNSRDFSKGYETKIGQDIGGFNTEFLNEYEALPYYKNGFEAPINNFVYWRKYPLLGWRKLNF